MQLFDLCEFKSGAWSYTAMRHKLPLYVLDLIELEFGKPAFEFPIVWSLRVDGAAIHFCSSAAPSNLERNLFDALCTLDQSNADCPLPGDDDWISLQQPLAGTYHLPLDASGEETSANTHETFGAGPSYELHVLDGTTTSTIAYELIVDRPRQVLLDSDALRSPSLQQQVA
jgi:hypothetical protein